MGTASIGRQLNEICWLRLCHLNHNSSPPEVQSDFTRALAAWPHVQQPYKMFLSRSCSQCGLQQKQQLAKCQTRPLFHTSRRLVCRASSSNTASNADNPTQAIGTRDTTRLVPSTFMSSFGLYLMTEVPAAVAADGSGNPFEGMQANSLYVTLGLFLLTAPGGQQLHVQHTCGVSGPYTATMWLLSDFQAECNHNSKHSP